MDNILLLVFLGVLVSSTRCEAILCAEKDGKDLVFNQIFYHIKIKPNKNNQNAEDALDRDVSQPETEVKLHRRDRYIIRTPIDVDLHHWSAEVKGVKRIKVIYLDKNNTKVEQEKIRIRSLSTFQQVFNTDQVQADNIWKVIFKFKPKARQTFFYLRKLRMLTCHDRIQD